MVLEFLKNKNSDKTMVQQLNLGLKAIAKISLLKWMAIWIIVSLLALVIGIILGNVNITEWLFASFFVLLLMIGVHTMAKNGYGICKIG